MRSRICAKAAALESDEVESGFTLIELMIVLLVLAILMAIAVPTFLGVANAAYSRAAQSNLATALTSARALYSQEGGEYPPNPVPLLQEQQTGLQFGATSSNTSQIGVERDADAAGNTALLLVNRTLQGTCWYIIDSPTTATDIVSNNGETLAAGVWFGSSEAGGPTCGTDLSGVAKWYPTWPPG